MTPAALGELGLAAPPTSPPRAAAQLAACVATFREWLWMKDPGALIVSLATVAANRADGDPVWLGLVGPPGGGKTEVLNSLSRLRDVYPAATLTEAALLSGTSKKEQSTDASGGLLRRIGAFGIIVCKDFGSVLSMHRDARSAVLAALREVYDGAWTRHVGTDGGRTLSWAGKVGLIAGCTPAIDSHHAVMGSMGERFVLYRLPPTDADAQARRALDHVGREGSMRTALADAVAGVLDSVDAARLLSPADDTTRDRLVKLSTLAVRCRSAVERDSYSREIELIPEAEAPARLALVLLRILNALRAIGADEATAWQLVQRCALDSMPAIRRTVLEDLIRQPDGATTTEIAERVSYPTTTARRALEDLTAHGIVRRESGGQGRADHWHVAAWTRDRWGTVPEMSEGMMEAPATVPEMSHNGHSEHAEAAATVPISLPLHAFDDKSGKVPDVGPASWCADFSGHYARHRDLQSSPWCEICSPRPGG
jgi:hypothetical protein